MSYPVLLSTPRLELRELREDDWEAEQVLDSDPEVARFLSCDLLDAAGTRAYLAESIAGAQATPRTLYELAIIDREASRFVGRVGLRVVRPEHREATLWFVLRRDCWGRGLAVEACTALIDFGFQTAKVHRVWADCDPRNGGSIRVMEKLGMRREGHFRENWFLKGEWCDSFVYAVLASEWTRGGQAR